VNPRARNRSFAVAIGVALVLAACRKPPEPAAPSGTVSVAAGQSSVEAGAPIEIEYRFARLARGAALPADAWVFVHVVDAAGALLWTDDHEPPTAPATWGDAEVTYRRPMFVPRTASPGPVRVEAGVFSRADGARVPMTVAGNPAAGGFEVTAASNDLFVVFGDGWHGAERVEQQQANEWRWSTGDARLSFRRPQRDVVLSLEIDQPVMAVGRQTAELRVGSDLLATLAIDPGVRRIHRVALPAARLGSAPTLELDVHVRPTFVPASITGLASSDTRELGVRVFNVHVGAGLRAP
jgi:hypothetical protein